MSFASVLVGLGMLFLSLTVIVRPWRAQAEKEVSPESRDRQMGREGGVSDGSSPTGEGLDTRRDGIYGALADLDFDRSIGKLNEEDYQVVRSQLMAQAVEVLRQLDTSAARSASIESEVEALVSARRASARGANGANGAHTIRGSNGKSGVLLGAMNVYCTGCGSALKPDDHFCGKCGAPVTAPRCPHCDATVGAGDDFCVRCGTPLLAGAAA